MSVEKWWNEICGWENLEKFRGKPTQTPFPPPWNLHGVTETRTRDPRAVKGERLTACATEPPNHYDNILFLFSYWSSSSSSSSEYPVQGQVFHCKLRNQGRSSSTANSGSQVAVLLGMDRCDSFPLFPHPTLSLASEQILKIWKDPRNTTWRWGEWFWLTWPSELHRNPPQGLNISSIRVFDQIRDPEIPIILHANSTNEI